jgi:hypothetical protein
MAQQNPNVIGRSQQVSDIGLLWKQYGEAGLMFAEMMGVGGGGGGSGGGGSTASGSSFVTPGTLTALLGDIPIANDGDVITADYHNSLRSALLALAAFLGQGGLAGSQTQTFGPALIPFDWVNGNSGDWILETTMAVASNGWVAGWMPLDLPDGVQLQKLNVIETREASLDSLTVTLGCIPLDNPTADFTPLAQVSENGGNGSVTTDSAPISPSGISNAAVVAALGSVDNSTYRYFLEVRIKGSQSVLARIYAFQIIYTLS